MYDIECNKKREDLKIIKVCEEIKEKAGDNRKVQPNGTILLYPGKIPNAVHIFYVGLSEKEIQNFCGMCKYPIPKDYLDFLAYTNGMELYGFKINLTKSKAAMSGTGILLFGLPRRAMQGNHLEPFDLFVEDLRRHEDNPEYWMKIGIYTRSLAYDEDEYSLFLDLNSGKIYCCPDRKKQIVDEWDSLDEALCKIVEELKDRPSELTY